MVVVQRTGAGLVGIGDFGVFVVTEVGKGGEEDVGLVQKGVEGMKLDPLLGIAGEDGIEIAAQDFLEREFKKVDLAIGFSKFLDDRREGAVLRGAELAQGGERHFDQGNAGAGVEIGRGAGKICGFGKDGRVLGFLQDLDLLS